MSATGHRSAITIAGIAGISQSQPLEGHILRTETPGTPRCFVDDEIMHRSHRSHPSHRSLQRGPGRECAAPGSSHRASKLARMYRSSRVKQSRAVSNTHHVLSSLMFIVVATLSKPFQDTRLTNDVTHATINKLSIPACGFI